MPYKPPRLYALFAIAAFLYCLTPAGAKSGKTTADRPDTPAVVVPTAKPAVLKAPDKIIGVWAQPSSSFAKWKDRGVNVLFGYEGEGGNVSVDQWCQAAVDAGLFYVLQGDDNKTSGHWNDINCVGVCFPDEANAKSNVYPYDPVPPAKLAALRTSIKERTNKPIFFTLDGTKLDWQDDATVKAYCDTADVIGFDRYLINRGEGLTTGWPRIKTLIDRLKRIAVGKRIYAFMECSDQNLRVQGWLHDPTNQPQGEQWAAMMRGPTVQEMTFQLDAYTTAGCEILYFPDIIGVNWEAFDGTPPDNAAALKAWNIAHSTSSADPAPVPVPVPVPSKAGPLNGKTAVIDGHSYILTDK